MEFFIVIMTIFAVIAVSLCVFTLEINQMKKTIDEINHSINILVHDIEKDEQYDEHCVYPLNKYTTFRIKPFFNGIKEVWDVEYRNSADTKWKVCRCEETEDKARSEMNELIEKIKKEEI